jgi:group II intron reverse transcriptase/maturase
VTLGEFEAGLDGRLAELREEVETGRYWCWPLRRVEVEKRPRSAERRTLLVGTVRDRVLETAVAAYLEPLLEAEFDDSSFGYRRGRSVRMAVERVHALFLEGYTWLVDADVQSFFDNVDREIVLGRLATLAPDETAVRLCRLWLDYAVWDGLRLTRPALGIPQGSVVSPLLANLCLDTLDDRMEAHGIRMVRYADDFVILTKSRPAAERALQITEETLAGLRLRLNRDKTRIVRFSEGFKFLGVIFLKDLLAQPWQTGARKRLKVLASAPPLPPQFFPASERRPLRRYRLV